MGGGAAPRRFRSGAVKQWYAVRTQAAAEAKADANLRHQGFETFLPRFRKLRRHARRVDSVLAPVFPRYLFVNFDIDAQAWRCINGTFGVVSLVSFGLLPSVVPPRIIEAVRGSCDEAGVMELPEPNFHPGQPLLVERGPLADLVGLFERISGDRQVILLVGMLGRALHVALPFAAVRAA
jgi:transcriptional antiterminator RfaH